MINYLSINNLVICKNAELSLEKGFTAITGDSGAGKSIIIDALSFALGERADYDLIMQNQDKMTVIVSFDISRNKNVQNYLREHELDCNGELIIKRVLSSKKTNSSFVQGEKFNNSKLKELGAMLVNVYQQNSHIMLSKKESARKIVDSIVNRQDIQEVTDSYKRLKVLESEINDTEKMISDRMQQAELNSYYLEELISLAPEEKEYAKLESIFSQSSNRERNTAAINEAVSLLDNEEFNVSSLISSAVSKLRLVQGIDTDTIINMLDESQVNLSEAISELLSILNTREEEEVDIDSVTDRISKYQSLARKHGIDPDELCIKLNDLQSYSSSSDDLEKKLDSLKKKKNLEIEFFKSCSMKLHESRLEKAKLITSGLSKLLPSFGLDKSEVKIDVVFNEELIQKNGMDNFEILFKANVGQSLAPISTSASGGEMSRVSLGLQLVLSKYVNVPTLVFDEADIGISGEASRAVGSMFKKFGESCQIITITHQGTVAACANKHFQVRKKHGENYTYNEIIELDLQSRIEHVAYLLTGDNSMQSQDSAKSLILS